MKRKRIYALVAGLAAVAAVALMLAYVVLPGGTADVKSPEVASVGIGAPVVAPAVQEVASRPGGHVESITVHGHWTIEVLNPDGSLAERREFDNALSVFGKEYLIQILAREYTMGSWMLEIGVSSGPWPCQWGEIDTACIIVEPIKGTPETYYFNTLSVERIGSQDTSKLVLSGSFIVANNSEIGWVSTRLDLCPPTTSPADCGAVADITNGSFAGTTLGSAIPVVTGQQVMVTVEISFS